VGNVTSYSLTGLRDGLYHIAITAYDDMGYESDYSQEISVRVDTTPPNVTVFSINDGAYSTNSTIVSLRISASDDGIGMGEGALMRFSNDNQTWSDPEPYSTIKENWDLTAYGGSSDEGIKSVYLHVCDAYGNWRYNVVDTIILIKEEETISPPTGLSATAEGTTVHIQWQASSDPDLDHYNLYVGYSPGNYNMPGSPFNIGKITSLTASDIPEDTYYLALSAVDSSGRESSLSEEVKIIVTTKPIIAISSNNNSYSPGDTLRLSLSINNSTPTTQKWISLSVL
jgi:hypothetical protein